MFDSLSVRTLWIAPMLKVRNRDHKILARLLSDFAKIFKEDFALLYS